MELRNSGLVAINIHTSSRVKCHDVHQTFQPSKLITEQMNDNKNGIDAYSNLHEEACHSKI